MVINTENLTLRPLKVTDAEALFSVTHDEIVKKYVPYAYEETLEETQKALTDFYANGDLIHDFYLSIELSDSNKMIGCLIVTQNMNLEFDMSLVISPEHRGNGYILEAIQGFISYMPTGSILLFLVERDNLSSLNAISKLNLTEEPTSHANYRRFIYVVK